VPVDEISGFIGYFNGLKVVDDEDWEIMNELVKNGHISMRKSVNLMNQCFLDRRMDVVENIISCVSDLTEKDFIQVILDCLVLSDEYLIDLTKIKLQNGRKNRKTSPQNTTKILWSLLKRLLYSAVTRNTAFSNVVLTSAVKSYVSPRISLLLLHLLSHMILNDSTDFDQQMILEDHHIRHAITWMESLIDAHLGTISILVQHDSSARLALRAVMKLFQGLDDRSENVEKALGTTFHIMRMQTFTNRKPWLSYNHDERKSENGQQFNPTYAKFSPIGVYTVETLIT
jgi:hypothetical protein